MINPASPTDQQPSEAKLVEAARHYKTLYAAYEELKTLHSELMDKLETTSSYIQDMSIRVRAQEKYLLSLTSLLEPKP